MTIISCDLGVYSCAVCEQPAEITEKVAGAECCLDCTLLLKRAIAEGGSILRWRCTALLADAPEVCGRVWKVAYQPTRHGPIVADTSGACSTCRPAQREYVEKALGKMNWEDASA